MDVQRLGVPGMETDALFEEQLGVRHLSQQGMAKAVGAAIGVENQQLVVDRLPQGIVEGRLGDVRRRLHQPVGDVDAADCGRSQHLLGRGREHAEAGGEDVVEGLGQSLLVAVERGRQQLLGVERVARRATPDGLDELGPRSLAADAGELEDHLVAVEPGEVDAVHPTPAIELGEVPKQRVATGQLVTAVRDHDEHRLVQEVDQEERQQVAGGAVGPVRVLDDEEHRFPFPQPAEHVPHRLEQTLPGDRAGQPASVCGPGLLAHPQLGEPADLPAEGPEKPVDLRRRRRPDQVSQRLGHRAVRQPFACRLDAVPDQDPCTGRRRPFAQLGDESALADPRLATDDHRVRLARSRPGQRGRETLQLQRPPQEGRTEPRARHGAQYGRYPLPRDGGMATVRGHDYYGGNWATCRVHPRGDRANGCDCGGLPRRATGCAASTTSTPR